MSVGIDLSTFKTLDTVLKAFFSFWIVVRIVNDTKAIKSAAENVRYHPMAGCQTQKLLDVSHVGSGEPVEATLVPHAPAMSFGEIEGQSEGMSRGDRAERLDNDNGSAMAKYTVDTSSIAVDKYANIMT